MTKHDEEFSFYTEEEIILLSSDVRLAQKRINKSMQVARLNRAVAAILHKMGYEKEASIKKAEQRGELPESSLYDAYLLAKYERDAARQRLNEMPKVERIVDTMVLFFFEVQKDDPDYWREMKEIAARKAGEINQENHNEVSHD